MHSATTAIMNSTPLSPWVSLQQEALLVRHCFQMSGHVILPKGVPNTLMPRSGGLLGPPPHLGSWIERPCNPLPDVADCGLVPCTVPDLGLPHMILDATVFPQSILDVTVLWTNLHCGGTDNECVIQEREESLTSGNLLLAASKAPFCPDNRARASWGRPAHHPPLEGHSTSPPSTSHKH